MNEEYYKSYPHVEKSLIDFLVESYYDDRVIDVILSSPKMVEAEKKTFLYSAYKLNRAFKQLKEIIKQEISKLLKKQSNP